MWTDDTTSTIPYPATARMAIAAVLVKMHLAAQIFALQGVASGQGLEFHAESIVEMLFRTLSSLVVSLFCSSPFVIRVKQLTDHWLSSQSGAANWMDNQ